MSEALLPLVTAILDGLGARHALIGAAALAAHGVARSTFDLDLLTTEPAVLNPSSWANLTADPQLLVSVRRGDAEDPLAGIVRIEAEGQRAIDVVVGRWTWQAEAIAAARIIQVAGHDVPVVGPADLILLKLYAGGSQDLWDIDQLLAATDRPALIAQVEARLDRLPPPARGAWIRILEGR
jgi:hypothetical protein